MAFNHGLELLLLLRLHGLVAAGQVLLVLAAVRRQLLQHHVQPCLRALLVQVAAERL